MAFAVTARHQGAPTETSSQTDVTDSVTPTASSLLLTFWAAERNTHTTAEAVQTPTGGGWTYTQRAVSTAQTWDGDNQFSILAALYSAPVSGSPGAHTVTVDSWSGTQTGFYATICCDITGHDTTTPFVQTKTNGGTSSGDSVSGTVTLDSTPANGNLVIVAFFAGADGGGGFAAPTIGGQAMTSVRNQNGSFNQGCVYYRVRTGAESNNVITCSDVGNSVGNWTAIAAEVAVATSSGATVTPGVIAATVAVPQAAVSVAAAPAQVAAAAALPGPVVSVGAAPAAVQAVGALPGPAVSVGVAPAVVPASVAMPQATAGGSIVASPAAVAAVAALPAPVVSVGSAPGVVAAVVTLPQAAISVGVAPAVIAALAALPQATPDTGGGTPAVVSPAAIAAVVSLLAPSVSVAAAPASIGTTAALPTPAVSTATAPAVITTGVALPAPVVSVGAAPAVVPLVVSVPQASPAISIAAAPGVIAALAALPGPAVSVGVAPARIAVIVLLPAVSLDSAGGARIHGRVRLILGGVAGIPGGGPAGNIGPS